jgi:hypothetical protein
MTNENYDQTKDYNIAQLRNLLVKKYGKFPHGAYEKEVAYVYLKMMSGFNDEHLPQKVYNKRLENIFNALEF